LKEDGEQHPHKKLKRIVKSRGGVTQDREQPNREQGRNPRSTLQIEGGVPSAFLWFVISDGESPAIKLAGREKEQLRTGSKRKTHPRIQD
jgi:hypothetical protein